MSEPSVFPDPARPGPSAGETSRGPLPTGRATPEAGNVGQRLRAARESRNLSVADAAQSLKLAPRQVEALETEDWSSLPGNTMIRGFVRNYARLLNLDSDELMRALDTAQLQCTVHLEVSAGTAASLPHASSRVERRDYLAVIAGLVLLGLAALAYFFAPPDLWQSQLTRLLGSRSPDPVEQSAPVPAVAAPAAGESVTVLATPNATLLSDLPRPSGSASSSSGGLKLGFAQSAWVEVRDGRGQIIFAEMSPAGSQREIDGPPPLSLVVGNASQVTVEYRGRAIELAPHTKGEVAKLTIE